MEATIEATQEENPKSLASTPDRNGPACKSLLTIAWLRRGPYSGRIIQAHFRVPFKTEEVSEDPIETAATIFLKLRRCGTAHISRDYKWMVEMMENIWGALVRRDNEQEADEDEEEDEEDGDDEEDDDEEEDDDWEPPTELDADFRYTGATRTYDLERTFNGTLRLTPRQRERIAELRHSVIVGDITADRAKDDIEGLIRDAFNDVDFERFDEYTDNPDDDYDNEEMEEDNAYTLASDIVDNW